MPIVTADSYGIDYTGATDVTTALTAAINAQPAGNTFQFHANGKYLCNGTTGQTWSAPGIVVDGNGATIFTTLRRSAPDTTHSQNRTVNLTGNGMTVQNLRLNGFRKDTYNGSVLAVVAGSPTVSGTTMVLPATNDEVRLPQVGLDWIKLTGEPVFSYHNYETPFYFRDENNLVKFEASLSATSGAGPVLFCIYNDETDELIHSQQFDPSAVQTTYTITFDPTAAHLGTRMRVTIKRIGTGGTTTVHSITPYNEAGFRNDGATGFNGGDEFSHGFKWGDSTTGVIVQDCWVEGVDGDGYNIGYSGSSGAIPGPTNAISRRNTVRGCGRQGYTFEKLTNAQMEDCAAREIGRSGVDFEPNFVTSLVNGVTIQRCTFLNIRNYAFAMANWARAVNVVISDITVTTAGMGGLDGGARGLTITDFTNTGTYRLAADRVQNGGLADADINPYGIDITGDVILTDIGVWLRNRTNQYNPGTGTVTYTPDNIHITNLTVLHPTLDPPWTIDTTNSTVTAATPSTDITWDSVEVLWDDPVASWDGSGIVTTLPAFQNDAFQTDAFQAEPLTIISGEVAQMAPAFTQTATGFAGYIVTITQTAPAFAQAGDVTVTVPAIASQTLGAFTQSGTVDMTVRGFIGARVTTFQEDSVQEDAFQTAPDVAHIMPAFTQSLVGAIVEHGTVGGPIAQVLPAFTQAADATLEVSGVINQHVPAFTQTATTYLHPAGTISQTAPAFRQAATGTITVNAFVHIAQTMPMFTQSLRASIIRWDEWPGSSGDEWPVSSTDEWLVRLS